MQAAASQSSSMDVSEHDKKQIGEERERNRLVHQAIAEVRAQAGAYLAFIPDHLTCLVAFSSCGFSRAFGSSLHIAFACSVFTSFVHCHQFCSGERGQQRGRNGREFLRGVMGVTEQKGERRGKS